jgi:hypothetical protein
LSFTRPDVTHCRYRALGHGYPHYTNRLNDKPPTHSHHPTHHHDIHTLYAAMQQPEPSRGVCTHHEEPTVYMLIQQAPCATAIRPTTLGPPHLEQLANRQTKVTVPACRGLPATQPAPRGLVQPYDSSSTLTA